MSPVQPSLAQQVKRLDHMKGPNIYQRQDNMTSVILHEVLLWICFFFPLSIFLQFNLKIGAAGCTCIKRTHFYHCI